MNSKKTLFFTLLIALATHVGAQVTLDHIASPKDGIGYDFYTVQISKTETKYLFADTVTNTFSLFNMDFTPFMSNIPVPQPFNQWTYQVLYVTRSLFDCDTTNIEYVYEAPANSTKTFYIMRTDGTQLFKLDSANGPYCAGGCLGYSDFIEPIKNTSAGAKLFLQRCFTRDIYIYSLCGVLPQNLSASGLLSSIASVKVFPNPSSGSVTFQISAPDNINDFELVVFDVNGKEITRESLNYKLFRDKFTLNMPYFSTGTYFYTLRANNQVYKSGQFILTQ